MKMVKLLYIAFFVIGYAANAAGDEVIEVIGKSPDKRFQVAIVYPSQKAKDKDKTSYPREANYGSRPVMVIDTNKKNRVLVSGGNIAQIIYVKWLPDVAGFGYYERDEANSIHELYLIEFDPKLALRLVILPDMKALVKTLGDDPSTHIDPKIEFLSQELKDYGTKGVVEAILTTRGQYGRMGYRGTLTYIAKFKTEDYIKFEPVFLKRVLHPFKQKPLPDLILLDKTKTEQAGRGSRDDHQH